MGDIDSGPGDADAGPVPAPTAEEALHATLDMPFEDAVPFVQLEHELADFETVKVTRLDEMIEGMLDEEGIEQTALLVMCHPEVARDALEIDPTLGGMLPCTTVVYEREGDDRVHVHHVSATKAIRDLGCAPPGTKRDVDALVDLTGEHMTEVWENIEQYAPAAGAGDWDGDGAGDSDPSPAE